VEGEETTMNGTMKETMNGTMKETMKETARRCFSRVQSQSPPS